MVAKAGDRFVEKTTLEATKTAAKTEGTRDFFSGRKESSLFDLASRLVETLPVRNCELKGGAKAAAGVAVSARRKAEKEVIFMLKELRGEEPNNEQEMLMPTPLGWSVWCCVLWFNNSNNSNNNEKGGS
jgi:hypothetical protein